MNKIITSLTLLAGLGLVTLAPQAHASDRYRDHGHHRYSQDRYDHDERRAYRQGYREARHDERRHGHSQRYSQYRGHDHYQRYSRHNDDIRVIFRF